MILEVKNLKGNVLLNGRKNKVHGWIFRPDQIKLKAGPSKKDSALTQYRWLIVENFFNPVQCFCIKIDVSGFCIVDNLCRFAGADDRTGDVFLA